MAHKAPGKHHREGISLMKLFKMFPDNSAYASGEGRLVRRPMIFESLII